MTENFWPYRRNVNFLKCKEAPIRPMIEELEFIQDKQNWGYKFHFGFFAIPERDFELIAAAMHAQL